LLGVRDVSVFIDPYVLIFFYIPTPLLFLLPAFFSFYLLIVLVKLDGFVETYL